ncbi:MAG TPA: lipoprotein LpqH [Mycobacterium sp.]|nr:lipoprotein LpqH [Mycobacterium sp.]
MIRAVVVAAGSAAIVVAGVAGCSSEKKSETKAESSAASVEATHGDTTASAGAGTAKVTIDGQPKEIEGQVVCATTAGTFSIGVGAGTSGVAVVMPEDASSVTSVSLGNIDGIALGYSQGVPGGEAKATKDGKKYTITGTATGVDTANPMQPMTKPFEVEVSCP